MKKQLFVTGISTEVGKTIISAMLVKALNADFWKPLQAGNLDLLDSEVVRRLSAIESNVIHPEKYKLTLAASPHKAALVDGISISSSDFVLPYTNKTLIIEGAGGLLVPISDKELVVDLIKKFQAEVVLVSFDYLGSINHTLLTIHTLRSLNIPIRGVIFNGQKDPESERIIIKHTDIEVLGRVPFTDQVTAEFVSVYAKQFQTSLSEFIVLNETYLTCNVT